MSVEEAQQAREELEDHNRNLSEAASRAPDYSDRRQYLEAIMETDISDASIRMLKNMTSRSFILSYLRDPEINEIKKLREITLKQIKAAHPDQYSVMKGELRMEVYDDGQPLKPLTQEQLILMDGYIKAAFADVARSREGFQQAEIGKVRTESGRVDDGKDDGGLLSFS